MRSALGRGLTDLVAAGCVGCVGACGLLLRLRQRHRRDPERSPIQHNRVNFMIDSGLILNVGSLLLLIGFVLPLLELRPCE